MRNNYDDGDDDAFNEKNLNGEKPKSSDNGPV